MLEKDFAFGWTDLNIVRHAELINNLSSMIITHLDVLNEVDEIKLAKKYHLKEPVNTFRESLPANLDHWEQMEPEYANFKGWKQDLSEFETFSSLPSEAQSFVRHLEKASKKRIEYVSVNDEKNEGLLRILR